MVVTWRQRSRVERASFPVAGNTIFDGGFVHMVGTALIVRCWTEDDAGAGSCDDLDWQMKGSTP